MNYREYLKAVYGCWLGKLIGIRLGAPVESWSSKRIEETYHGQKGYLVDYGIFASDDDANGPLFFSKALRKGMTSEDVGKTVLAYLQEYSGFFWWGGVGVSTEHTAYENLKKGIKAPMSGSKELNGIAIAEQIGGQIFSDCWAYVSLEDPDEAVRLGRLASKVSHDGDGNEGAAFVCAATCLALRIKDPIELIDESLKFVDVKSHYYEVAKVIEDYYLKNHGQWRDCLDFIHQNYGYDRYPGVCHIIPNMAVMVMALCYGEGDFARTLTIANEAGWDTDCNCGNLGSIMGAMVALEGISASWIEPINDILNSSSCIGYLNIDTVSATAKGFADLAFKYRDREIEEVSKFYLPYSTNGFFGDVRVEDECLLCRGSIYRHAYYVAGDLYDARYDPCFSPIVYPGDELSFVIESKGAWVCLFVEDCEGHRYAGEECLVTGVKTVKYRVPAGINFTVHKFGVESEGAYRVVDYSVDHKMALDIDFKSLPYDEVGKRYLGDSLYNIRGFVAQSGEFKLDGGLVMKCKEHSLISTGVPCEVKRIEAEGSGRYGVVFGMEDALHYKLLWVDDSAVALYEKNEDVRLLGLFKLDLSLEKRVVLDFGEKLLAKVNGEQLEFVNPGSIGLTGFGSLGVCEALISSLRVS